MVLCHTAMRAGRCPSCRPASVQGCRLGVGCFFVESSYSSDQVRLPCFGTTERSTLQSMSQSAQNIVNDINAYKQEDAKITSTHLCDDQRGIFVGEETLQRAVYFPTYHMIHGECNAVPRCPCPVSPWQEHTCQLCKGVIEEYWVGIGRLLRAAVAGRLGQQHFFKELPFEGSSLSGC